MRWELIFKVSQSHKFSLKENIDHLETRVGGWRGGVEAALNILSESGASNHFFRDLLT